MFVGCGGFAANGFAAEPLVARLPIDFVENRGQWAGDTKFVAHKGPLTAAFETQRIVLQGRETTEPLVLRFANAAAAASVTGESPRAGRYGFFFGNDPTQWQADVRAFNSVRYRGLYAGVDLLVREDAGHLEYDLCLAPNADLDAVVVAVEGISSPVEIADDGTLLLHTAAGSLRQSPPKTWETLPGGERREIACRFRKIDDTRYGFEAPEHDRGLAMTIDPGLEWSTFLGGSADDSITGLALTHDGSGDVVVVGQTRSADFPRGASGNYAAIGATPFVARMNSTGTALVYMTFFGGSNNHNALGLALNAADQPVVVGDTTSVDFPTTPNAYKRTPPDGFHGDYDAYVIQFNTAGNGLVFSTYLGTLNTSDQARCAGFDPVGNVIVAGYTGGNTFPTTPGAFQPSSPTGGHIFLSCLDRTGSALTYSTYFGAEGLDAVFAMAVDSQGVVTITGKTTHGNTTDASGNTTPIGRPLPTTPGAFDTTFNGYSDAFLARFKLDGAGAADLKYATFLGGKQSTEAGVALALNPANEQEVTVCGWTRSGDFPTTPGALLRTHFGPLDTTMAWVARFNFSNPTNGSLLWSTFYGAPGGQSANDVVVDATGAPIIVGEIVATNPPTTERAFDRVPVKNGDYSRLADGASNAFIARLSNDGSQLLYSTLLGGAAADDIAKVVYLGGDTVIVAGHTRSPDFPVTAGAFDTVFGPDGRAADFGTYDGFLARFTLGPIPSADTVPPPAPALLSPAEGAAFSAPTDVTLDWTDVADASGVKVYHLQVSPRSDFIEDPSLLAGSYHENWPLTSFAVVPRSVSNTGTFYWRVQALDRAGNLGPWSAVRTFNVQSPTPPPAPVLTNPANSGRYAPGNVTLAWSPAPPAKFYELQVDTNSSFSNPNKIWLRALTSTQQAVSLTNEGTYWWRVRGSNDIADGPFTVGSFQIKRGAPAAPVPPPPQPAPAGASTQPFAITLGTPSVLGGGAISGTVTLATPAPTGGATIALASQNPAVATVQPSVTIPAGSRSANFTGSAAPGRETVFTVAIGGESAGITQGALLMVFPDTSITILNSLNLAASAVTGGGTLQGSVTLVGAPAPAGGAVVALASTDPTVAAVPPSVTIPAGTSSANFTVTTSPVASAKPVTILASRNETKSAVVTVSPPPTAPTISALALNPANVVGGNNSQGTVTLSGPAPGGGAVVALTTNSGIITIPASLTVPAGASSATFTITTTAVRSATPATITASSNGTSASSVLTVSPPAAASDNVSISRAEYAAGRLRIDATGTNANATLGVFVTSTNAPIGTLTNNGGGKYSGQFAWSSNPGNITVRSSLGGVATRAVTAK